MKRLKSCMFTMLYLFMFSLAVFCCCLKCEFLERVSFLLNGVIAEIFWPLRVGTAVADLKDILFTLMLLFAACFLKRAQ